MKAHKGHQQVFESAKNSREREKGGQYLWHCRDLVGEKKILKKREQQLRGKKGRTCRNRKYLVVGKVLREGTEYFKREGDRKFLRGR